MTTSLKSRLSRVEAVIMPAPPEPLQILYEPDPASEPEVLQDYAHTLAEAKASGQAVFVVVYRVPGCIRNVPHTFMDGVDYFGTDWEAQLAALHRTQSKNGFSNRLFELSAAMTGQVVKVVSLPMVMSKIPR